MSTYNGEKYLPQQIDSILNQKDVDVNLLIRDDGSTDKTTEIIKEYSDRYPNVLGLLQDNLGVIGSFYQAAKYAFERFPEINYFAFSDQDDFWLPEKLISGIENIKTLDQNDPGRPSLYFCPPKIVDKELSPINKEWGDSHYLTFEEACMIQPCAGCTMVFNRRALELFLKGDPAKMSMHDSWLYKTVLACGGRVIEDKDPHILYRQHGENVIGASNFVSRWKRRFNYFTAKTMYRSRQVSEIISVYGSYMPEPVKATAKTLSTYSEKNIFQKLGIVFNPKFKTKGKIHNILFKIAVLFNRY